MNNQTAIARKLRNNLTEAEKKLWYYLKDLHHQGVKFRRQQPIGNYFVDFVCLQYKLIIKVDGGQHFHNKNDKIRDNWLKQEGYKVLRYWNNEILENIDAVIEKILLNCK